MYRAPPVHHYDGRLVRQPQQSPQKLLVTLNLLLGRNEPEQCDLEREYERKAEQHEHGTAAMLNDPATSWPIRSNLIQSAVMAAQAGSVSKCTYFKCFLSYALLLTTQTLATAQMTGRSWHRQT